MALSTREAHTTLTNLSLIALWEVDDKLVGVGAFGRVDNFRVGGVAPAVGEILLHGPIKEEHLLLNDAQELAVCSQPQPAQVDAVFGYWRTTMSEWKEENARIEALWRHHPEGASQLALQAQDKPRQR